MNKSISTKKTCLYIIGRSVRDRKDTTYLQLAQKCILFNQNVTKFFSSITLLETLWCYARTNWKPSVCSRCKLWIHKFLKKQYLLIFDNSCAEDCNLKEFVDIASAGRYCGLSTIYNKHTLFHQSKLGRNFEIQKAHIVPFNSPRDVIQVSTLSTQMGIGSELDDWYLDATSVPHGLFLIDLSPRTDDRLRYSTNTRSIPPKFLIPDRLKTFDDEHTQSLYSPGVPINFPQMQTSFPSV